MNRKMMKMRFEDKMTIVEIAEKMGLSKQRVHQLTGNKKAGTRNNRSEAVEARSKALEKSRYDYARSHLELTTEALASELCLSVEAAAKYWAGARHTTSGIEGCNADKGSKMEEFVSSKLTELGIGHILTNSRPYDMILADGRTVEIKSRYCPEKKNPKNNRTSENFYFWCLTSERAGKKPADIYIFAIVSERGEVDLFVVPARDMNKSMSVGFVWPRPAHSRSALNPVEYHNNFEILR